MSADIVICGGGSSGAALAGILARDTDAEVLLLEAGPDYGALDSGQWPADLLDARRIPTTHGWGYSGPAHRSHQEPTAFDRASVIGGCSAHNGCVALLGHRRDYDRWAELGNLGWAWDDVAPAFARVTTALRVRTPADDELTPFHAAFLDAAVSIGIPRSTDMNDPDELEGVDACPVNIADGTRWNTALAYLDPVRDHPNLTVLGEALVDRVEIDGNRAVAVHALIAGEAVRIEAATIVLAAGAYGSPAILLRSGVGPAQELQRLGRRPVHNLPGVGGSLADHPAIGIIYRGTERLHEQMATFGARYWLPDEQTLAKARSSHCQEAFDLHIYAVAGWRRSNAYDHFGVAAAVMDPISTGRLALASLDPTAAPRIDHNYLSDPDGHDVAVLHDGLDMTREIMASVVADGLVEEVHPGTDIESTDAMRAFIERTVGIYYHPACTCRMGPATDTGAVVDSRGRIHGIRNLHVCDASIFPTLMRANTNLPAVMLAEHLALSIVTS